MPQMPKPAPVVAPPPPTPVQAAPPPPKQVDQPAPTPPPMLVQGAEQEAAPVKRKKTKRKEIQQASRGTAALTIPLNTGVEGANTNGLNIPTA